ncbi:MAG: MGH1-like glycoside hydrolase domain-containing protein [Candidatus Saccharimonadales bacterium]
MSAYDELFEPAKAVLEGNDQGRYTRPAKEHYLHQWLWDSCFIAIGLRHIDIERAKLEVLSLFRGQWSNGMLPNMIFEPSKKHFIYDNIWQSWRSPLAPYGISTSGITQPPILAEAITSIGEKLPLTERRSWYKQTWENLLVYHEWLYSERDPHKEGLVLQIHPWETGLDNTPPWMQELNQHLLPWWIRFIQKIHLDSLIGLFRNDTHHIPARQRLSNIEALAMFDTQLRLRRKSYDINKILDHSLFIIEDLSFNCILVRANEHLRNIATTLREELPDELKKHMELAEQAIEELWDPYTEQYYSRDFITHRLLKEPSIATLLPLYAGSISKEHAALLVSQLENENVFGTSFPVPSTPANSSWFNPERYWQGPTWVNTNWMIIEGLNRYGYKDHAETLRESTLDMVQKSGYFEYFNPLSGEGLGNDNFSWTAALVIDLLKR